MTFCECDDELPAHEHRAGDFWIPVDWKAVAREFIISGERPDYLMRVIHILAEAMMDQPRRYPKISKAQKRSWQQNDQD